MSEHLRIYIFVREADNKQDTTRHCEGEYRPSAAQLSARAKQTAWTREEKHFYHHDLHQFLKFLSCELYEALRKTGKKYLFVYASLCCVVFFSSYIDTHTQLRMF